MKTITLLFLTIFLTFDMTAQKTLVLKPNAEEGKDAFLRSLDPQVNRGDHPDFIARTGTNGGDINNVRSIIEFDLTSIPSGSTIINASFSLFSYDSPSNGTHRLTDNMNDCYLKRVTEAWDENEVTWSNQPQTTESIFPIVKARFRIIKI